MVSLCFLSERFCFDMDSSVTITTAKKRGTVNSCLNTCVGTLHNVGLSIGFVHIGLPCLVTNIRSDACYRSSSSLFPQHFCVLCIELR